MAKNLRAKIPEADTMTVFDVNAASLEKFSQEASPSGVIIAKSPREVAENAVSTSRMRIIWSCLLPYVMSHLFYL